MNPFDAPAGACLPADMFPLPSQKLKTFLRGQCVLGTTGYGFCNASMCLSNDTTASSATSAASVMASNTLLTVAIGGIVPQFYTQLPWTIADVGNNLVQGRGVALGLRVRYAGTEANRNGILNFFEDPDHALFNTMSYDTIRQRVNCYSTRPPGDGSWSTVLYSGPVAPSETEFTASNYLSVNGSALLVCVIKGNPGDVYEFEAFQHIEAIGVQTTGKSQSHSDSTNYGKVQETAKNAAGVKSLAVTDEPSVVGSFLRKVVELAPFVIQQGSNVMKALEGNPMALLDGMASSAGLIVRSAVGQYSAIKSAPVRQSLTYK